MILKDIGDFPNRLKGQLSVQNDIRCKRINFQNLNELMELISGET